MLNTQEPTIHTMEMKEMNGNADDENSGYENVHEPQQNSAGSSGAMDEAALWGKSSSDMAEGDLGDEEVVAQEHGEHSYNTMGKCRWSVKKETNSLKM